MTPIPLTASQIREIDEISTDKLTNDETLKVALTFHSNRANELKKRERRWWEGLGEIHGLEIESKPYAMERIEGRPCIVEKEVP